MGREELGPFLIRGHREWMQLRGVESLLDACVAQIFDVLSNPCLTDAEKKSQSQAIAIQTTADIEATMPDL